jgi:catechol 2,3-dioxygenase-like lactoylglutathione lyase family enzyme
MNGALKLTRFVLISADPARLAHFYADAFSFEARGEATPLDLGSVKLHGLRLELNKQTIDIMASGTPGEPYPPNISGSDPLFQHFAIVVSDMQLAYERLRSVPDWQAMSTAGPERLPASSGGVEAFKFRDPEGHPLEFLAFPVGKVPAKWQSQNPNPLHLGIDHSAISVSDTAASIAFYKSLGLSVGGRSLNQGIEQSRLDAILEVTVDVTSLVLPNEAAPHVELLCYRASQLAQSHKVGADANAIAATELVFSTNDIGIFSALCKTHKDAIVAGPGPDDHIKHVLLRDPDGHLIRLECLT